MKKNKKLIIGICATLVVIAIVVVIIWISNNSKEEQEIKQIEIEEENGISKLESIQKKVLNSKNYSFSLTLNEENERVTLRNGDSVKIEINDEGKKETYIIKGGNTYLLVDSTKKYYEYENNVSLLNTLENNIKELLQRQYTVGTEVIDNKTYRYEEFEKISVFLINYKGNVDDNNAKTRLYFEGNDLKYIKTYVGQNEQLLKVKLEFDNQKGEFNIPSDYSK